MKLDSKYKAVCFDMDGTLIDTHVDYVKMADLAFGEMIKLGVPESAIDRSEEFKFNLDSGIRYLKEHYDENVLHEADVNICKVIRDIEMERVDEARPFEGTLPLLDYIHSSGLITGVLTRGCREYAETALKRCNVFDKLDGLVARDDYPEWEAKPSPVAMEHMAEKLGVKANEILYFGDHLMDYLCARDSGADFVAVLSGSFTEKEWNDAGAEIIFDSVTEFYNSLKN